MIQKQPKLEVESDVRFLSRHWPIVLFFGAQLLTNFLFGFLFEIDFSGPSNFLSTVLFTIGSAAVLSQLLFLGSLFGFLALNVVARTAIVGVLCVFLGLSLGIGMSLNDWFPNEIFQILVFTPMAVIVISLPNLAVSHGFKQRVVLAGLNENPRLSIAELMVLTSLVAIAMAVFAQARSPLEAMIAPLVFIGLVLAFVAPWTLLIFKSEGLFYYGLYVTTLVILIAAVASFLGSGDVGVVCIWFFLVLMSYGVGWYCLKLSGFRIAENSKMAKDNALDS